MCVYLIAEVSVWRNEIVLQAIRVVTKNPSPPHPESKIYKPDSVNSFPSRDMIIQIA